MDSKVSESADPRSLRRSTRLTPVLGFEATPRGPLKRVRKDLEKKAPGAIINGSKDEEKDLEVEESLSKKRRLDAGGPEDGRGDQNEMEVQESESPSKKRWLDAGGPEDGRGDQNEMEVQESGEGMEKNGHQDMPQQDSPHDTRLLEMHQGNRRDVNLNPRVVLGERCKTSRTINEDLDFIKTKTVKPSTKAPASPAKTPTQFRPQANRHDVPKPKITSKEDYKRTMELKAKSTASSLDVPRVNHRAPSMYPASVKSETIRRPINNIPQQSVHHKKQDCIKKPDVSKRSSGNSSTGFRSCSWILVLLVLFSSAALMAHKFIPVLQKRNAPGGSPSRVVKPEKFSDHLSLLETQFPTQRPELWKRSKIHLEKHLTTEHPKEPVSLILTAGRTAERTLRCLAQGLASSFSSALNASVLHIDGTSKAGQDSDEVKLDIDTQLQAAFEGEQPVAVIHHFEDLPPGSTLIFYRYCDHENAAYKRVFLLFTVVLPQDEVRGGLSLKEVEEMVQDYVKERLVGSSSQADFNTMDADKFGGLWSRISHLILPVVSEVEVEQKGC
ncbi:torsin-1A-interacting protein 1-like isoform X2 [Acanthochromis polyacanthus]|uniref:torsin-1A-interacting protein 1-like isoform X2 n=1 Tax=Acanthochromis polyacanthus TaxID=80966 RepID=UPI0022340162|nr:torsin-1A-interacting protein 1-like isoform X2 [Acanthochromis polyacanthus]